jgi:ketosteroid isomerase-like protein
MIDHAICSRSPRIIIIKFAETAMTSRIAKTPISIRWLKCMTLLSALLLAACVSGPPGATNNVAVEREARALWDRYLAALNALDLEALSAVISDNPGFSWAESNRPGYDSKETFMQAMEGVSKASKSASTTVSDVVVTPENANRAHVTSRFVSRFVFKDNRTMTMTGRFRATMRAESDGWRIVAGETTMDGPGVFTP